MKKNLLIALAAAGLTLASCSLNQNSQQNSQAAESNQADESSKVEVSSQATSSAEETKLAFTDGYYHFAFGNEGTSYNFYFHFYDNGIFYYQQMNGKGGIGYWTLTSEKWTGKYAKTRDDKVAENYTDGEFAKSLKLTTLDGKDAGNAGYDEATDALYGFTSSVFATYGQQQVYEHLATSDKSWGAEASSAVCEYQLPSDTACKITINHDGTYNDLMGEYLVEGKWAKNGDTYTLTPDDKSDKGGTLKVSENGKTATYTQDGGQAQQLDTTAAPAKLVFTYVDDGNNGEGYTLTYGTMTMALEVKIEFYDDGTAVITKYVGAGKNENVSDGSWSGTASEGIRSCNIDGNGISDFDENGAFTIPNGEGTIKMVKAVKDVLVVSMPDNDKNTITFLSDGTFAAKVYSGQATVTGTWSITTKYALTVTLSESSAENFAIACEMDTTSHAYVVTVSRGGSACATYTLAAADWGSKLMEYAVGPKDLVSKTSGSSTITFKDDGTYEASFFGGQGGSCKGTWEWASQYSFAITVGDEYTSVVAGAPSLSADGLKISFTIGEQATVEFVLTTEEWQKTK